MCHSVIEKTVKPYTFIVGTDRLVQCSASSTVASLHHGEKFHSQKVGVAAGFAIEKWYQILNLGTF